MPSQPIRQMKNKSGDTNKINLFLMDRFLIMVTFLMGAIFDA
jgi:hypothetical protein